MSTKEKSDKFINMTLRDGTGMFRPVQIIPGVGSVSQGTLNVLGFTSAAHLIGQYLLFSCDQDLMRAWLQEKLPNLQPKYQDDIVNGIEMWCQKHL